MFNQKDLLSSIHLTSQQKRTFICLNVPMQQSEAHLLRMQEEVISYPVFDRSLKIMRGLESQFNFQNSET